MRNVEKQGDKRLFGIRRKSGLCNSFMGILPIAHGFAQL